MDPHGVAAVVDRLASVLLTHYTCVPPEPVIKIVIVLPNSEQVLETIAGWL